ncbi:glutamate racemase [Undibacterium jejuense]|uniref:Glutamate racemase n=1 Tax=Undibacterium jejuense TaxID=1344949 RepID=A0A923HH77_9BURK|nr:glutamate racemase [Undibacterium jejuense]MBC3863679.1 glutamate racemase [Undibacterium jejuense]
MKFDRFAPVGVFDSGIGGLSVLQHIRHILPHESLIYFADSAFAPYGEKSEADITERCIAVTEFLLQQHIKALVVACNTATAAAIKALRERYPDLIIIGIEPGLKPAATISQSNVVGVLATQFTLQSEKFNNLRAHISAESSVQFEVQACVGLVNQIEKGELRSVATLKLVRNYVTPLLQAGADTLVLGCTHYPFVVNLIEQVIREYQSETQTSTTNIQLVDTGLAVATQLQRLLEQAGLSLLAIQRPPTISAYTTSSKSSLRNAFNHLLKIPDSEVHIFAMTDVAPAVSPC